MKNPFCEIIVRFADELEQTPDNTLKKLFKRSTAERNPFEQQIIRHAARILNAENYNDDTPLDSAESLRESIQKMEKDHSNTSWSRKVSAKLQPLVNGMSLYIGIVDTLVQYNPAPGALVWGGAKLLLQVSHAILFSFFKERNLKECPDVVTCLIPSFCLHFSHGLTLVKFSNSSQPSFRMSSKRPSKL
jgi:hypothetical protein